MSWWLRVIRVELCLPKETEVLTPNTCTLTFLVHGVTADTVSFTEEYGGAVRCAQLISRVSL